MVIITCPKYLKLQKEMKKHREEILPCVFFKATILIPVYTFVL